LFQVHDPITGCGHRFGEFVLAFACPAREIPDGDNDSGILKPMLAYQTSQKVVNPDRLRDTRGPEDAGSRFRVGEQALGVFFAPLVERFVRAVFELNYAASDC
jgi:hypothetical protein